MTQFFDKLFEIYIRGLEINGRNLAKLYESTWPTIFKQPKQETQ